MENTQRDDVSILQIRIFLTAAQTNSFSATAQQLYLTQPTVSKWMAKLERQLGCRLFTRKGSGVELTRQGEMLMESWKHLLEVYDHSVDVLDEQEGRRVLRVGVLTQLRFAQSLSLILRRFDQEHPEISVELEAYDFRELHRRLLHGDLDAAFGYSFDFEEESGLTILPIHRAELFLAGMPEVFEKPEAEGYHTLLMVSRSESRRGGELAMAACVDMGFQVRGIRYFPNLASVELAARQGKGVMVAGNYLFHRNDALMRFPVPGEFVSNYVSLAWMPGGEKPAVLALVGCVKGHLTENRE